MKNKEIFIKVSVLAVILLAVIGIIYRFDLIHSFNFQSIVRYVNSYGKWAVLVFILIFSIRTIFVVLPYWVMVAIGGSLFGPVRGFIYSMIGVFISATIAFYGSRFLGKEMIQRLLKNRIEHLDSKAEKHGFKIIFLMRVSSVFPFDILGYASGLTKIKFKDFILATILGMIPETFALTYLGNNLKHPFSPKFLIAILLVAVIVLASYIYKKMRVVNQIEKEE